MNKKTKELNRINNSLDKQVNPENKEAFTDKSLFRLEASYPLALLLQQPLSL